MAWNWQHSQWPDFVYQQAVLDVYEREFLKTSGILIGAFKHIHDDDKNTLIIDNAIQKHKKAYYDALEHNNKGIEITDWLVYFSKTILQAQLRRIV
jgi:hypothetical protein